MVVEWQAGLQRRRRQNDEQRARNLPIRWTAKKNTLDRLPVASIPSIIAWGGKHAHMHAAQRFSARSTAAYGGVASWRFRERRQGADIEREREIWRGC